MPKYKRLLSLSKQSIRRRLDISRKSDNAELVVVQEELFVQDNLPNPGENGRHDLLNENEDQSNLEDNLLNLDDNFLVNGNIMDQDITCFLQCWSTKYNIKSNALNELLVYLKSTGFDSLPIDSRTLLHTPRSREILECPPGVYFYNGIGGSGLRSILNKLNILPDEIIFDFNIDGVPISKSTQSCFWPILAKICNIPKKNIYAVSVYHGLSKPNSFNQFLRPFIDELKLLMNEGYLFEDKKIKVKVRAFICDAPARSGILGIKSHTAYFGCPKCCVEGEYIHNRMTYPIHPSRPRTDESFRQKEDENHHNYVSTLEELNINMVEQFPLDYLHAVCLGPVKKLLKMWISGDTSSLLPSTDIKKISDLLLEISITQPSDFQRKIRPLKDLSYFKGTEFRVFLLYSGPFVLKNILPDYKYKHFLLFHTAILILSSETYSETKADFANILLKEFVSGFASIYGRHHITFNMHCLTHLVADVKKFGTLDAFSAFPFESYMFEIKNMLRKPNQPLAQLCNRLYERNNMQCKDSEECLNFPILKNKKVINNKVVYKRIILKNFQLGSEEKNAWFLTKNKDVVRFEHVEIVNNKYYVRGTKMLNANNFYEIPVKSSNFDIYKFNLIEHRSNLLPLQSIEKKMFMMKTKEEEDNFIFFPILHSNI